MRDSTKTFGASDVLVLLERKCEYCGKRIEGEPVVRYSESFCSREHVANYFGSYVEETWDEVYWTDFY